MMVVLRFPGRRSDEDPEELQRSRVLEAFKHEVVSARAAGWSVEVVNRFGSGPADPSHDLEGDRWALSLHFVHPIDPFGVALLVEVDDLSGRVAPEWCEVFVYNAVGVDTPDVFTGLNREPLLFSMNASSLPAMLRNHRDGVTHGLLERWLALEPDPRNTRAVAEYLEMRHSR